MAQIFRGGLETALGEHPMSVFEYKRYESAIDAHRNEAEELSERIKGGVCKITPEAVAGHDRMKEEFPFIAESGLDYEKLCYTYIHTGMVDIISGGNAVKMEMLSRTRKARKWFPLIGRLVNLLMFERDAKRAQKKASYITSVYWGDKPDERLAAFKATARTNYWLDAHASPV